MYVFGHVQLPPDSDGVQTPPLRHVGHEATERVQLTPEKPLGQVHLYESRGPLVVEEVRVQVPPLLQGFGVHLLALVSWRLQADP